jgi:hypothetical protein
MQIIDMHRDDLSKGMFVLEPNQQKAYVGPYNTQFYFVI